MITKILPSAISKIALISLYLLPALATLWFILHYGVNVPQFDQWILPTLFHKVATGSVDFNNFFGLHNYHRLVFPKLIFVGLGFLSKWNIFAELLLSFLLATLTFIALYKLSSLTNPSQNNGLFHITNLVSGLLFFSWIQYDNWLWGFQIALFLINFCTVIACLVLVYPSFKTPQLKLIIAAILCGIASFSSAQGLASWLGLIPSVWQLEPNGDRKKYLIVWIGFFTLASLIYLNGYQPDQSLRDEAFSQNPELEKNRIGVSLHFFLNLLASPLVGSTESVWILGGFLLFCFIALGGYLIILSPKPEASFPINSWLSIGLFSLICMVLITQGRYYFGADYAILESSRFTTHTLLFIIALIQLALIAVQKTLSRNLTLNPTKIKGILIYGFFMGILTSLIFSRFSYGMLRAEGMNFFLKAGQTCLTVINYIDNNPFIQSSQDSCLLLLYPQTDSLREEAKYLDALKFRNFPKDAAFIPRPNLEYGHVLPLPTNQPLKVTRGSNITLQGWAILPNRTQQPHIVFLSYSEQSSFFANAFINIKSPDIATYLHSERYNKAGWQVTVPAKLLPLGQTVIKAWVYDPQENQFLKLRGGIPVIISKN